MILSNKKIKNGRVSELVDDHDSKSCGSNPVRVRVPPRPPISNFREFCRPEPRRVTPRHRETLAKFPKVKFWCPRWDSNPQPFRDMVLSHARIPIPPRGQKSQKLLKPQSSLISNSNLVALKNNSIMWLILII